MPRLSSEVCCAQHRPFAPSAPTLPALLTSCPPCPADPAPHRPLVRSIATVTPTFHILGAYPPDSPLEQCLAVDAWLLLMVGIALPLATRAALESEARAAFTRQLQLRRQTGRAPPMQQRGRSAAAGSTASAVQDEAEFEGDPPEAEEDPEADPKPAQPHVCWRLLLISSGAWAVSCLAAALCLRNAGGS